MNHAEQIFIIISAGDDQPGVLVFLQQGTDFLLRCAKVYMLDIMARGHNTADGALVEIKHPPNHPAFLGVEQRVIGLAVDQRGRIAAELGVFFMPAK